MDQFGKVVERMVERFFPEPTKQLSELAHVILHEEINPKLARNSNLIIAGFLVGSWGNLLITDKQLANEIAI